MSKIFESKIYRIIVGLIKAIFVILILTYLGLILFQRISGNGSIAGYRVFSVASPSMVPVYEINDVLLVKETKADTLKVGDDITYQGMELEMAGKIVTHRIIEINTEENGVTTIQTKGVANKEADPKITGDQVYGKVVTELGIISLINNILRTQVGFFCLIFVPLVLLVFLEIVETINDRRKEKTE